jgi:predicted ATPase/class 3 adenylate cyclase
MPALPSGTVTFLFTDIQGSTRLWEEHPEVMRLALARHDALMRSAIEQHNGHVFKTIGDAFCAAFATAPDALHAAFDAQLAIASEPWPENVTIIVRMALHTGAAEVRDNDYFGQPLNRAARLLSAGHGGQVLLSLPTKELTRDALPPAASLQTMGEHRLRDLNRPETVYQLLHPDLPAEFPPLKSLDNSELPNNLPRQLTSFIGREREIAAIKVQVTKTRLLTLTGSGGSGKTRLALQMAADVLDQYPDGVWFVELAPLADPALVPQVVATALGLSEQKGRTFVQTLADHLKFKHLLLVLDNCEHLLSACAQLCDALLRACAHLTVLATSREGLGISGEQTYRVPSLSLPDPKEKLTLEQVSQYEAVRLFIERAVSSKADFVVTNTSAPALAAVCHRLDGIPLAIELAAARVRSLSVEEINTRLDNRFRLLTGGSKTALPRQQTLRALIDWSYGLLTDGEKWLLGRLSVFAGGWTLAAAEQVGAGESADGGTIEEWEVLDLLTNLVDKSLVIAETQGETARYRLLETVRQYARDRLVEAEEVWTVRARHWDHFLALAEAARPKLRSAEQAQWLAVLEQEHDNLRLALAFCLEEPAGGEAGLRLGAALYQFWSTRGHLTEGRQHLSALLSRPMRQGDLKARADALNGAGLLAQDQGDTTTARALHEESLTIKRELGDKQGIAISLNNLGIIAQHQGNNAAARTLYEECMTLSRDLGDKLGIAYCLMNLGNVAQDQGDTTAARALHEESLTIKRELGDKQGIASSLGNLGIVARQQNDYVVARALLEECLTLFRELGDKRNIASAVGQLGTVAQEQGDTAVARVLHEESLTIKRELGDKRGIATSLMNLGSMAQLQGDTATARALFEESLMIRRELGDKRSIATSIDAYAYLNNQEQQAARAARLWGAATALREAIELPRVPSDQEQFDREVAEARSALGEAAFAAAWDEGHAMILEQAVEYALKGE